jgi:hypothetical protein
MKNELTETEAKVYEMIERFKENNLYLDYLEFVDEVCWMIKCDFMLNTPKSENELADRIIKSMKFIIDKNKGKNVLFFSQLENEDLNMIGALILGLIEG